MELNEIHIVDRRGNVLVEWHEEQMGEDMIVNNNVHIDIRDDIMFVMCKDYDMGEGEFNKLQDFYT